MVQRRPRHVGDMPTFSEDAWGRWPFDGGLFGDFDKQLEEIMEAFHGPPMTTEAREDEFVITGEVPGMSPDQVQVEVKDGHLVITGPASPMKIPVVTSNRPGATSESESGSVEVSVDDQA
eukprot:jgi/Pico_ML_1/52390/g3100.t1